MKNLLYVMVTLLLASLTSACTTKSVPLQPIVPNEARVKCEDLTYLPSHAKWSDLLEARSKDMKIHNDCKAKQKALLDSFGIEYLTVTDK